MSSTRVSLPIDSYVPQILAELKKSSSLILRAPPGTGKSTRLPPALADHFSGKILVLEPRRLAARLCAERVAQEWDQRVGARAGYRIRFESAASKDTQVEFLTEGLFVRMLLDNPLLRGVDVVVIDEFHERHIHTDLALLTAKKLQQTRRPDLQLLVMSATLGTEALASYLPKAAVVDLPAKHFEVRQDHLQNPLALPLEKGVHQAVLELLRDPICPGHILVFLSGLSEQRRCSETLQAALGNDVSVLVLHSSSTAEDQRRVFAASPHRKIILATNIAETSLTIDGVTGVVDSGFAKIPIHSPYSGHLELSRRMISQASAIQRAGRAGRTAAGVCKRLYTAVDYSRMTPFERPEIERLDFTQTLLETRMLFDAMETGVSLRSDPTDPREDWLTPPTSAALKSAEQLLQLLGALDGTGRLTPLGREMAALPLHPRLSRIMAGCKNEREKALGVLIAASLSEEFSDLTPAKVGCDLLGMVTAIVEMRGRARDGDRRLRLLENLCRLSRLELKTLNAVFKQDQVAEMALRGFPDRVCQLRKTAHGENYIMCQGGHGALNPSSSARSEPLLVALEIHQGDKSANGFRIERACPLSAEGALAFGPSELIAERVVVTWDQAAQCVRKKVQTTYGELPLEESTLPPTPEEARPLLADMLRKSWPKPFTSAEEYSDISQRLRLLQAQGEAKSVAELENDPPLTLFEQMAEGRTSFSQVLETSLKDYLRDFLSYEVWSKLEEYFPREVQLKGKKTLRIHYEVGRPPWIEAKVQEFFGTTDIPRLANGRVPITVQILAPNGEAMQTTADLRRFWSEGYPSARATWSRHYPRHFWPEDPLTAPAQVHRPRR